MPSVEPFLSALLTSDIQPSPARRARAIGSHNHVRNQLCTGHFSTRIRDAYLSGSYSRDTAIDPLDDVDIVFIIDPEKWPSSLLDRLFQSKPEPDTVLNSFATALRRRYERSSVRTQRRSVRLELVHLNLDIVPAIQDGPTDLIWIPDREEGDWIKSGPKRHMADGEEVNRRNGGRFKPLVKLLKYWNSNRLVLGPPSISGVIEGSNSDLTSAMRFFGLPSQ